MDHWLALAKGPFFRFSFVLMALGMARLIAMQIWSVAEARRHAGDKNFPARQVAKLTLSWMIPINKLHKVRPLQSFASFVFHVGMLLIPLFYIEHVALWKHAVGFGWFGFSRPVADVLTVASLVSLVLLFGIRLWDPVSRALSKSFDYIVLLLLFVTFLGGFFSSHPASAPIPYNMVLLIHILTAELVLIMIPFTKLAHAALFATIRVSSEIGWKFIPGAGEKVKAALGKEGRV
jgi:nitrate reductase gamma subunit